MRYVYGTDPAGLGSPVVSAALPGLPIVTKSIPKELPPLPNVSACARLNRTNKRTEDTAKVAFISDSAHHHSRSTRWSNGKPQGKRKPRSPCRLARRSDGCCSWAVLAGLLFVDERGLP